MAQCKQIIWKHKTFSLQLLIAAKRIVIYFQNESLRFFTNLLFILISHCDFTWSKLLLKRRSIRPSQTLPETTSLPASFPLFCFLPSFKAFSWRNAFPSTNHRALNSSSGSACLEPNLRQPPPPAKCSWEWQRQETWNHACSGPQSGQIPALDKGSAFISSS